ncbi:hypothetical protein LTR37_012295 [Vermiconidia calcicola]|uniref:Uncharacterized protein n=1 Tax=Vermiconidia calcicola TaxID=1690605 RepID=A0ACC3N137_9PEZI|nr:hypothetical protein LTR37_012295 [Vermiconidia calcicola]
MALDQAVARWAGMQQIRDWVLNHARDQVLNTFQQLRAARYEAHLAYLQTLPCYTLFQRYSNNPPIPQPQLQNLYHQISQAQAVFQAGIDEDWRRSCLRYPDVLDYYFSLVDFTLPDSRDLAVREPRFGAPLKEARKIKARRDSVDLGSGQGKKGKRRSSRGRTPPAAPMPGSYRR